jgi:hypothetical protein
VRGVIARAAALRPLGQMREEDAQDRRLHLVEPAVHPELLVTVAVALPAVAQPPQARRVPRVAAQDGAPVAERPEVLRRVEGEGAERRDRAHRPPAVEGAVRLAGVLEHGEAAPVREFENRLQVRGVPVEVHGHDRPRARGDRPRDGARVEVEGRGVDVHEHRPRARLHDGERGERGGERRRHDLVSGPRPERAQAEVERVGAVRHRDRVLRAEGPRELALERLALGAEDEPAGVEDARDGGVDLATQRGHVRAEVDEGDGRRRHR